MSKTSPNSIDDISPADWDKTPESVKRLVKNLRLSGNSRGTPQIQCLGNGKLFISVEIEGNPAEQILDIENAIASSL